MLVVQAQYLPQPALWLRSDSLDFSSEVWRDVSGQGKDGQLDCPLGHFGEGEINFNKSVVIDDLTHIDLPSVVKIENRFMCITVYQSNDSLTEQNLWQVADSAKRMLFQTTTQIGDALSSIEYNSERLTIAVVTSHSQQFPRGQEELGKLVLGSSAKFPFNGTIAEFMVFNTDITDLERDHWESYLAVKYGLTLRERNYYNSCGKIVWDYLSNIKYNKLIIGIGRDNFYGLNQRQSISNDNQITFGATDLFIDNQSNTTDIPNKTYIILGADTAEMQKSGTLLLDNGFILRTYGDYLIQTDGFGADSLSTFLILNTKDWEGDLWKYSLLVDRSGEGDYRDGNIDFYLPEQVDSNKLVYKGIYWDTDKNGRDKFCITYLTEDSLTNMQLLHNNNPDSVMLSYQQQNSGVQAKSGGTNSGQGENPKSLQNSVNFDFRVAPNPSTGTFSVIPTVMQNYVITVSDAHGTIIYCEEVAQIVDKTFNLRTSGEYNVRLQAGKYENIHKVLIVK